MDLEELSKILATTTHNWKQHKGDDFFLFQFIASIMDLIEFKDKCCLTDDGRNMLLYTGLNDALKAGNETKEQKQDVFKATLYLFIGYTLSVLYIGFLQTKNNGGNADLWEQIPCDVYEVMEEVKEELFSKMKVYKGLLEHLTKSLDENYAKLFNTEKRRVFNRDLFNNPVIELGDEVPELTEIKRSAIEMKS